MQFKHPEILFALLLLIIPIIVHLFQLQRFVKVPFTNVKFLKSIEQQTRKSARLKKWLILATRILAFTCLIFAFSQPYFSKKSIDQNLETTIYLDNSFSMQAKGRNGELLKTITQKIIEHSNFKNHQISIVTNDEVLKNIDFQSLKNKLINIKYYPNKLDLNTAFLKLNHQKSNTIKTLHKNILISDFQNINIKNKINVTNVNSLTSLIKVTPNSINNIFIDSVYIDKKNTNEITVKALVKSNQITTLSLPISLFDEKKLVGKATAKFDKSNTSNVTFSIPNATNFNGKISLTDDLLEFDNDFYFSISKPEKLNVLCVGNQSSFLEKIYTKNEFNFTTTPLQNLNYNTIYNQHLILLNEIEDIPNEFMNVLNDFSKNGGDLVVIPSKNSKIDSYNRLFASFSIGKINSKIETEHKITTINYTHPLLKGVFEKRVTNFQYPTTKLHYHTNFSNESSIVKLDNNQSFITSFNTPNSTLYWINAPLNKENSNFIQSPLIVPIFYNFAKNSIKVSDFNYTIAPKIELDIKTRIGKDNVLKVTHKNTEFIPLQKIGQNKVSIILQDNILESGFYNILHEDKVIKTLAFNYNREESELNYANVETLFPKNENITVASSIDEVLTEINDQQKINWLFKWFLVFSVLFLLIEMLILKYFKI